MYKERCGGKFTRYTCSSPFCHKSFLQQNGVNHKSTNPIFTHSNCSGLWFCILHDIPTGNYTDACKLQSTSIMSTGLMVCHSFFLYIAIFFIYSIMATLTCPPVHIHTGVIINTSATIHMYICIHIHINIYIYTHALLMGSAWDAALFNVSI